MFGFRIKKKNEKKTEQEWKIFCQTKQRESLFLAWDLCCSMLTKTLHLSASRPTSAEIKPISLQVDLTIFS
jgi:hypothetical protein